MKKAFRILAILVATLCLLRGLFGVVDGTPDPTNPFVTTFDIIGKIQTFTQAEVFDFDKEIVDLQIIEYSFNNLSARMGTNYGETYRLYYIYDGNVTPPQGQNLWTYIQAPDLSIAKTITEEPKTKGEESFFELAKNFFVSIWDLLLSIGKLIADFIISMVEAIAELARLFISIVFKQ